MKDEIVLEDLSKEEDTRSPWIKRLPMVLILGSLVMLAVASGKYYVDPAVGFADETWAMAGHSIIIALVSYLIWRFYLKKKGIGLLYFSIIFFVVSSYRCARMMEEVNAATETAEQTAEQAVAFAEEYRTILQDIVKAEHVEPKMFDRRTYGELTPILQALNSYKVQNQKDLVAMREEMEGPVTLSLVTSLVKPETIKSLELIKEGKAKLAIHRGVYEKYIVLLQEREQKFFQDMIEVITDSGLRHERKQILLASFAEAEVGNLSGVSPAEVFAILISIVDETTSFLDFLESKQGKYTVFGRAVLFESQENLDTFNKHKKEIIRIEAQFWSEKERIKGLSTQYADQLEKGSKE